MNFLMIIKLTVAVFLLYWAIGRWAKRFGEKRNEMSVYLQRLWGAICFAGIPLLFFSSVIKANPSAFGLTFEKPLLNFILWLVFALLIIPLGYKRASLPQNLAQYPQIRVLNWNIRIIILSSLSWLLYLAAYEFLFRGLLLFVCYRELGANYAVAINVILYMLAHLPKGRFETLGAAPLGLVLCILSLWTESFWVAFGIHAIMALTNEWFSAWYGGFFRLHHSST